MGDCYGEQVNRTDASENEEPEVNNAATLFVIPAKAGIHFDFDRRNMDSRFRGNDGCVLSRE